MDKFSSPEAETPSEATREWLRDWLARVFAENLARVTPNAFEAALLRSPNPDWPIRRERNPRTQDGLPPWLDASWRLAVSTLLLAVALEVSQQSSDSVPLERATHSVPIGTGGPEAAESFRTSTRTWRETKDVEISEWAQVGREVVVRFPWCDDPACLETVMIETVDQDPKGKIVSLLVKRTDPTLRPEVMNDSVLPSEVVFY